MYTFQFPTKVVFGQGSVSNVGEEAKNLNVKKVFIVTDKGITSNDLHLSVEKSLKNSGIEFFLFDEVEPNPTVRVVERGLEILKENKCDGIIAIGGGSSIDAAKGMGIMATNPGRIVDYSGFDIVKIEPMPIIAIPTTSGTGSEVTLFTVLTDEETKFKMSIGGKLVSSTVAIIDPEMTETVPPFVTATTGIDAMIHAIESYLSVLSVPYTEAWAMKAIELVGESLRIAYANGSDMEARTKMSLASMMAGAAFNNTKLGVVHAMANTYGGYFPSPHGAVNAILLPYCMKYNFIAAPKKFAKIAELLGENIEGLTEYDAGLKALDAIDKLIKDLNIPTSLKTYGFDDGLVNKMAKESFAVANAKVNCRKVSVEDIEELYRQASK